MENQAGRRRGEPAGGGGAGGRRGRPRDRGEPRLGDPAADDPPGARGAPRNGGRGGGPPGGHGGKQSGYAEQRPLPVGPVSVEESTAGGGGGDDDPTGELQGLPPAPQRDGEEGNAGGRESAGGHRGSPNGDGDRESLNLGGRDGLPGQRADEVAAGSQEGKAAGTPPAPRRDGKKGNAGGRESAGGHRGSPNGDDDRESHNLGGRDGLPGQRADEVAAGSQEGKAAGDPGCQGVTGGTAKQLAFHVVEETAKEPMAKKKRKARAAHIPAPSTLLPPSTFLSDAVLSWTVKEVLDDQLYKDKVQQVPTKFDSADQFIDVYSGLLLEETRSSICAAIENNAEIQYCQLINVKPCDTQSIHYLDIDLKMTRSCGCCHIAQVYDVCLLSDKPITDNPDIMHCSLGLAFGIGRETFFQTSFRVVVSNPKNFRPEKVKYVSFLTNIKYIMEISRALSLRDGEIHVAVEEALKLYEKVGKRCSICSGLSQCKDDWNSQKLKYPIPSLKCFHQNNTEIIWAPPGTLKGSITAVLKDFLHMRPKILICVPSPSYIPNILMDLQELSVSPDSGDVLVLNNTRGLENCFSFINFSLEHQSQELYCCSTQCQGTFKMMSSLLDLSRYRHTCCTSVSSCARCNKTEVLDFSLEDFTKKFSDALWYLQECLVYLNNHAVAFSLLEHNVKIRELMVLMEEIEALLHDKNLNSIHVEAAFDLRPANNVATVDSAYSLAESLNRKRMSSIQFLSTLIKSIQLPQPYNRDDTDRLCIKHSSIIISTVDCTWQLYGMEMDPFDILVVHGASQIKEDELLVPLLLPVKHIVLFGDSFHLQPSVQSKISKAAGYGVSIFERLHQFTAERQMLTPQLVMHPLISKFPNRYFYKEEIEDGQNVKSDEYNKEFQSLQLPTYGFIQIPTELQRATEAKINCVVISFLLEKFYEAIKNAGRKYNICVVCISSSGANEIREQLITKTEIYSRVNVQVKPIDGLQGELYDLIILSFAVKDYDELKTIQENIVNVALTSPRHCLWMVGEREILLKSGGIWKKLFMDATDRKVLITMDLDALQDVLKQLKLNPVNHSIAPNSAHSSQKFCLPGQEFSWAKRPERTKYILAPIRDQRGQADTCAFQSSCGAVESLLKLRNARLVPPQGFDWDIFVDDLKNLYDENAKNPFQSEGRFERGEKRLYISLDLFRDHGVLGSNNMRTKFRRFKIKAYGTMDPHDTEAVTARLENGSILIGRFLLSRNYYRLRPGEVYVYDPQTTIMHPISGKAASHAAMMIGIGHNSPRPECLGHHMVMQNSLGQQFGINGIGRVGIKGNVENEQTLRCLYWIEVEDVKPRPASSAPAKESDAQQEASSSHL